MLSYSWSTSDLSKAKMSNVVISDTADACKPGMTPKDVIHYYNDWAKDSKYDKVGHYRPMRQKRATFS